MNPGKGGKSILNSKLVKRDEEGNLEYTIGQAAAGNGIVKITSIREPFEDDNL